MNAPLFTNQTSPELLRSPNTCAFTQQQIAGFNEKTQVSIQQQADYKKAHPPIAVYRVATQGSQTRNGGLIQKATSPLEFTLASGQKVRGAREGDSVVYHDGSTAQIVTGSGKKNGHLALVGSLLSNGDEIINTPQGGVLPVQRKGVAQAEDFLPKPSA